MATMGFIKSTNTEIVTSSIIVPETFTHSIAFGQTGCGKTTSFIYPNLKNRLELGHGILLYDYKGKEHLSVKYLAEKAGRLNDVVEIGKPWGENINLIQNMDEEELDHFFDNILKHGDDQKYWQNSAKSLGQSILKILKAIECFSEVMVKIDSDFDNGEAFIYTKKFSRGSKYPTKRTITSLVGVCNTFNNLVNFIKNLNELEKTTDEMIKDSVRDLLEKSSDENLDTAKLLIHELIRSRENLLEVIKESSTSLDSFGDNSNENLTQNIIGSLISPLISLSQNSFFNTNSFDIASALNNGKIIVINTQALSDAAVESLSNAILHELTQRTRSVNLNPISIFMDEAQRILSKATDLPIDVLREAKVDVFLSTQNSALLKDKLKSEKFDALMGNLTNKFYFKSSTDEELETSCMLNMFESFEYISSEDSYTSLHTSKPLYIDLKQKINIEYKYQKKYDILKEYAYEFYEKKSIVEFVPRLYKDKKLILIDIKTMKEQVINSLNLKSIAHIGYKVEKLFKEVTQEVDEDLERYNEYEVENECYVENEDDDLDMVSGF